MSDSPDKKNENMTGSCVICGELFNVAKDNILDDHRVARQAMKFGAQVREHIQRRHQAEYQDALNAGMAFAGIVAMSYIHSDEALFNEDVSTVRDRLMKAADKKEPPPLITTGDLAAMPTAGGKKSN